MKYFDQILQLAEVVPVFPCRATTRVNAEGKKFSRKRPHITRWRERATQDPIQLKRWWRKWPDALPTIPTGSKSGLFVIDFDGAKVDRDSFDMMAEMPHPIDEFNTMQLTKQGVHIFYKVDPDRPILKNSQNKIAEFVDTRGEGGYICMAPSSGYTLIGSLEDAAPVPEWVYEQFVRQVKATRKDKDTKVYEPGHIIKHLELLDPADYPSYEEWMRILLSCFHASDGNEEVRDYFKEWSAKDTAIWDEHVDDKINDMWESASTDIENVITFRTLKKAVKDKHGGVVVDGIEEDGETVDVEEPAKEKSGVKEVKKKTRLQPNNHGEPVASPYNLKCMLEAQDLAGIKNNNKMHGLFRFNKMSERVEFSKKQPWEWPTNLTGADVGDSQIGDVRNFLSRRYKTNFTPKDVSGAILNAAMRHHSYHPIQDWLESIKWDGKRRLTRWLHDMVGTSNAAYYRQVGKRFLIAAVARVMDPGCQLDTVPVFEGAQGIFKGTIIKALAGMDWYRELQLGAIGNKDTVINCYGSWIIEIPEMHVLKRNSVEEVKNFITIRKDTFRTPYGIHAADHYRSFIFVGTMNPSGDNTYIHDVTGARRFWPIVCGKIDIDAIKANRTQLFAEAKHCYEWGDRWHFTPEEEKQYGVKKMQAARQSRDSMQDDLHHYLYLGEGKEFYTLTPTELRQQFLAENSDSRLTNNDPKTTNRIKRLMIDTFGWVFKNSTLMMDGKRDSMPRMRYVRPYWEDGFV